MTIEHKGTHANSVNMDDNLEGLVHRENADEDDRESDRILRALIICVC